MIRTIRAIARAERFAAATAKKLERAQDGAVSLAAPAAPDQRRDPATDGEPGDRRAHDHRGPVLAHLAAPVGERVELRPQVLDRHRQLMTGSLDRAADLLWASGCHGYGFGVSSVAPARAASSSGFSSVSRIRLASS